MACRGQLAAPGGGLRTARLERNVERLLRHRLEQFACDMGEVAEAGGTVVDLSRARAGHIDQLCERLRRERRMHDDHQPGRIGDVDDRREVAQRVVRELAVDRWIDGVRPGRGQQRLAVGRRARDEFGADDVVGAATLTLQSRKAPDAKDAKENPKKYEYRATIHAPSVTPYQ